MRAEPTPERRAAVEEIRNHADKHGVVWITERGLILLGPAGDVACIKGATRKYFNDDCPFMFIEGYLGLSGMWPAHRGDVGSDTQDELLHHGMWIEMDKAPAGTGIVTFNQDTVQNARERLQNGDNRPLDERLNELKARLNGMTPEEKRVFREHNEQLIKDLLTEIALEGEIRRRSVEKGH